tara:strand:- start:190 stop:396 length:207 start_codon:yes stop_codon:yes gene_type:complete
MEKYNNFINSLFYLCVDILNLMAKFLGISYELINILIFIIIYPLLLLFLFWIIYLQRKKIFILENKGS